MPGPNVGNRVANEKKATINERQTYFLTDPKCESINGIDVTDAMRQNGIVLTSTEAMTLVASGAVSTSRDEAEKAGTFMKDGHEALTKRREDEAYARRLQEEEAADAVAHNTGQSKPTGTMSLAEVDQHMKSDPAASPPTEAPEKTWAQSGV